MNAEIYSNDSENPVSHKLGLPIEVTPRYSILPMRAVDRGRVQKSLDVASERGA
jgi:hypothetical protein